LQAKGARGLEHVLLDVLAELDGTAGAAAVDVAAEVADLGLAPHRADHPVADDEGAHVLAFRFRDELLQEDDVVQAPEGLQDRLEPLAGLRQHDPDALRSLEQLEDAGDPSHLLDGLVEVLRRADDGGAREVDVGAGEELEGQELVARVLDRLRRVDHGDPHDLELVDDGAADLRDRRADARDHDVDVAALDGVAGEP
jgi:hypothetical protein